MADHPSPDWLGPALGAAATFGVGLLGWLGIRTQAKAPKADPQVAINAGFNELLDQMRAELIAASRERNTLKATLLEREEAWRLEREAFKGEIAQLRAVAEGFERLLRRNGISIPERKAYPEAEGHPPARVVETTLRQDGADDAD